MTQTHTLASDGATPATWQASRRVLHLVCGACGGDIAVERDTLARYTRCPRCSHRLKVVRSVFHTCAHCGAKCYVDITSGSTVAICQECERPYTVGPVTAPAVRSHPHHHHAHPQGREGACQLNGMQLIVGGAAVLIGALATLWLVFS